ncbi:MAG: hypothetical protein QM755_24925 [Luteolibacter sp.]
MNDRHWLWIAGITCTLGVAAYWMPLSDDYLELDMATGSSRSRHVVLGAYDGGWKTKTTWLAERARELGIPYHPEWKQLSHTSRTTLFESHGCSPTPPAYLLPALEPEDPAQRDAFVRDYLAAPAGTRKAMIEDALKQ